MAGMPCSFTPHRYAGKAASIYWAWNYPSGLRVAHKTLTCYEHTAELLSEWVERKTTQEEESDESTCAGCGGALDANGVAAIFATVYLPGQERVDYDFWFDEACAQQPRARIASIGRRLQDRGDYSTQHQQPPEAPWGDLIPRKV